MSSPDIRWIQRFDNFKRAFARLSEASELAEQRGLSDLERQGLIQAFELNAVRASVRGISKPAPGAGKGGVRMNHGLSEMASLTHPALLDHIRRVGIVFYEKSAMPQDPCPHEQVRNPRRTH